MNADEDKCGSVLQFEETSMISVDYVAPTQDLSSAKELFIEKCTSAPISIFNTLHGE
jgi:hypothetical protein